MREDGIINAQIRHPATIEDMKKPSPGKRLTRTPITYVGFDIETDPKTGEARLMYDSSGTQIFDAHHTNQERYENLLFWLKYQAKKGHNIVSWTQFDHIALFRIILDALPDHRGEIACARYGRLNPAVATQDLEFHTFNNVQNIKIITPGERPRSLMVVDAKRFFNLDLETTCKELGFNWYSKLEEKGKLSVHVVQWDRYLKPQYRHYRYRVRKSCMMDAKAAGNIIESVQMDFKELFGFYPKLLSSTGGLAKAATASLLTLEEYRSLYFKDHLQAWKKQDHHTTNEFWCMTHEAFSAGLIESFRMGYHPKAITADIASAYPSVIVRLCDLKGSTIHKGSGPPPKKLMPRPGGPIKDYVLIRGTVTIPKDTYHTIGFKNALGNRTQPYGTFPATYNQHERSWAESQGATFQDETWVHIKTQGKPHPLANVCNIFLEQRGKVRKQMGGKWSSRENIPKIAANSLYGICYEHINEYLDDGFSGSFISHSTGELYNPLLAGYITSLARLTLVMGIQPIETNRGKPVLAMTDSVHWTGSPNDLPRDIKGHGIHTGVRKKKTLGFFEKPKKIKDFYCFGTGRYEYKDDIGEVTSVGLTGDRETDLDMMDFKVKARSYFLKKQEGIPQTFHESIERWLKKKDGPNPYLIHSMKVTPGLVRAQKHLTPKMLNRITEERKDVMPLNVGAKRKFDVEYLAGKPEKAYKDMLKGSVETYQMEAPSFPPGYLESLDNTMAKYKGLYYKQLESKPPKKTPKKRVKMTDEQRKAKERERSRKRYQERKQRLEKVRKNG